MKYLFLIFLLCPFFTKAQTASFVNRDTVLEGSWKGTYGMDGYSIEGIAPSLPSYATFTPLSGSTWTWASPSTDARALNNIGSCWYGNLSVSFDLNVGPNVHSISLYFVDWDSKNRSEMVSITNKGAVLDQELLSNFTNGVYLTWNITDDVTVAVTDLTGPNAVVSGVFFSTTTITPVPNPAPVPPTCPAIKHYDTTVWTPVTGAISYNVYRNQVKIASVTTTTFTDNSVAAGQTYTYDVTSVNANGESPTSPSLTITVPTP